MRILIISTTLTVVCVGAGAVLSSPLSPVSAGAADQPAYHHPVVVSAASVPDTSAVDTEDAVVQRVGRSNRGAAATGPAYPSASGTPTPASGPTLPTLPTDVASILPSIGPDGPFVTPTDSASPSASPSASQTGTSSPSPTASPSGSDGDGTTGGQGGDDHDGGLVCLLLPVLCG